MKLNWLLTVLLTLVISIPAAPGAANAADTDAPLKVIENITKAINDRDYDGFLNFYADDAQITISKGHISKREWKKLVPRKYFEKKMQFDITQRDIHSTEINGDTAVVKTTIHAKIKKGRELVYKEDYTLKNFGGEWLVTREDNPDGTYH